MADQVSPWKPRQPCLTYGKRYMGMERSSFLVDADGRVARVWRKVKPEAHAAEVLKAAQALGAAG